MHTDSMAEGAQKPPSLVTSFPITPQRLQHYKIYKLRSNGPQIRKI